MQQCRRKNALQESDELSKPCIFILPVFGLYVSIQAPAKSGRYTMDHRVILTTTNHSHRTVIECGSVKDWDGSGHAESLTIASVEWKIERMRNEWKQIIGPLYTKYIESLIRQMIVATSTLY
jgi:hypothetical protein